jgi:hypothetical protein
LKIIIHRPTGHLENKIIPEIESQRYDHLSDDGFCWFPNFIQ